MTDITSQNAAKLTSFRDVRSSRILGGIAIASVLASVASHGGPGLFAPAIAIYCIHAALVLHLGVTIRNGMVSFPRAAIRALPLLVVGRIKRPTAGLEEITYLGQSFGVQRVLLRFSEGHFPVSFRSRNQRLAFFSAVRSVNPMVRIYRAC